MKNTARGRDSGSCFEEKGIGFMVKIVEDRSETALEDISVEPDGNMAVGNDGRGLSSSYW